MSSVIISPYSFSTAPTDPSFSSVVFLWEAEGTNGQNSSLVDATGKTITASGTGAITTSQARFGSSSYAVGTGGCNVADSADWDLSDANSSQFTMEFSGKQTAFPGNWDIVHQFGGSGARSWLCRWGSGGDMTFFYSNDGAGFASFATSSAGATSTSAWYDWCIEKNSSGKIRIYLNGVMKGSDTPADSSFFNAAQILNFSNHATPAGYIDHIRISKGVARYNSDSGYTLSTGAFPTS